MTTIKHLLVNNLLTNSATPRLDVELLLAAALAKPVSYLHTWPDEQVASNSLNKFNDYLQRRQLGEPIAYILGRQGFWSLELQVNEHTLIPRPDTETLVEVCLDHLAKDQQLAILDLGTGTGAIALALAVERPLAQLLGVDYITAAVQLAEQNRQRLSLTNVVFKQSNWFTELGHQRFDLIVSNPPYIAADDPHLNSGDVRFEPATALISGIAGLDDIKLIIQQAPGHLQTNGWLFLEHGYQQAPQVQHLLKIRGFKQIATYHDLAGKERVTGGQWLCN